VGEEGFGAVEGAEDVCVEGVVVFLWAAILSISRMKEGSGRRLNLRRFFDGANEDVASGVD
jgi:hypothetical protein